MPHSQTLKVQLEAAQKAKVAVQMRLESVRAQRDLAQRELAKREADFAAELKKRKAAQLEAEAAVDAAVGTAVGTAEETAAGSAADSKTAAMAAEVGLEGDTPRASKGAVRRRAKNTNGKGRGFKDGAVRGKGRRAASSPKGSSSEEADEA